MASSYGSYTTLLFLYYSSLLYYFISYLFLFVNYISTFHPQINLGTVVNKREIWQVVITDVMEEHSGKKRARHKTKKAERFKTEGIKIADEFKLKPRR
jgi:hypothetical protein